MLPDGQTIPVNLRDLKAFITKDSVAQERMITGSSTLEELSKDTQTDINHFGSNFFSDFLEWSFNPKFFAQVRH
jgi:hypothetical protein